MLKNIVQKKLLPATAQITFYRANSVGDGSHVFNEEDITQPLAVLHGLRQQAEKEPGAEDPYICISDFVAPLETGVNDYIGCFASSCFGAEKMVAQ